MAEIIRTDGVVENITPKNGTRFTSLELIDIVGGFYAFQTVGDKMLVYNGEGRLEERSLNETVEDRYKCVCYGDVLVCSPKLV